MKTLFFNTSTESWDNAPYMVKEHSVPIGKLLATVVVVPVPKKPKKGEKADPEALDFLPMGVRIEWVNDRTVHKEGDMTFVLPGQTLFVKFPTKKNPDAPMMVSETGGWGWKTHRCGVSMGIGTMRPEVIKPRNKWAGVPIGEHRMAKTIELAVRLARESYEAWKEEKRAAA